jgi:hypothetical protein
MSLKRKFLTTIAMSAMISTTAIVNAGPSQAATIYKFRLSQFAAVVANVCVHTDTDTVCTGKWGAGGSEVFDVPADSLNNWWCDAEVVAGSSVNTNRFSRYDAKECYLEGSGFSYWLDTKS